MNRRGFIQSLAAVPVAVAVAPLIPKGRSGLLIHRGNPAGAMTATEAHIQMQSYMYAQCKALNQSFHECAFEVHDRAQQLTRARLSE